MASTIIPNISGKECETAVAGTNDLGSYVEVPFTDGTKLKVLRHKTYTAVLVIKDGKHITRLRLEEPTPVETPQELADRYTKQFPYRGLGAVSETNEARKRRIALDMLECSLHILRGE